MSERHPITQEGYERLREEIKNILSVVRPQNIKDIEEALAHGDLKENAEYHAAKDKQGHIEARLQYLNDVIANSEVVDTSDLSFEDARFGAKVSFLNLDTEEESQWFLVGKHEADVKENKISIESPIGRALLGKRVGDEVTVKIPRGNVHIEITDIQYGDD